MKNTAIVTGASSGLGRAFVKQLNACDEVDEIWAIARNRPKLEQLRAELGDKIRVVPADLTQRCQLTVLAEQLQQRSPRLVYLVNNAGFAKFCSYAELSLPEALNMIDLNCSAVVAMCNLCIPFMRAGSHIINIASAAAFLPLPYQNLYSSTKALVRNYSRALNVELKEKDICVTAVCPGWIDTALFQRAQTGAAKATTRFVCMASPEKVAAKALKDARRNRDESVYGVLAHAAHCAGKLLPQKFLMKLWLLHQHID